MFCFLLFVICSGYYLVQNLYKNRHKRQEDQRIDYIEDCVGVGNLPCQVTGGHGNIMQIERNKGQHDQGSHYVKERVTKGKSFTGQITTDTGETRSNTCTDINPEDQINRRREIEQPGRRECYNHSGSCAAAL